MRRPADNSLASKVAALTHDVTALSKSVDTLANSMRDTTSALSDHVSKLSDRIAAAEKNRGPTWTGIAQVASIIATYTVLLSALVALYVRGEINAASAKDATLRESAATSLARMEARLDLLETSERQSTASSLHFR